MPNRSQKQQAAKESKDNRMETETERESMFYLCFTPVKGAITKCLKRQK